MEGWAWRSLGKAGTTWTARHPVTGDRWRLKGALYEHDLDGKRFLEQQKAEPSGGRETADGDDDASRAAEASRAVEKMRVRREEHHRERYGGGNLAYRERASGRSAHRRRRRAGAWTGCGCLAWSGP